MTTTTRIIAILVLMTSAAHAQEINLATLDAEPNRVHVTTGAEYAFVAGAGYTRVLPFLDRHLVLGGEVTLPWAGLDVADYKVRASALVPVLDARSFKLAASLAPLVRGSRNAISSLTDLGVDVALAGGYYTRRFFAALELGLDAALTTHVTHSDDYRMRVFPDAVDGWYANPGANLRAGLQLGASVARYDVMLRIGRVVDIGGEAPLFPMYGTITVDARF